MSHVALTTLDALAASRPVRRRDLRHVDRCVTCRRAAAERGISEERIAAALATSASRPRALFAASALAACIAVVAVVTPLRGAASGFFAAFEPHTVAAVPLTLADIRNLERMPDLSAYASTRALRTSSSATYENAGAAAAAAGFALRQPAYAPPGTRAVSYEVESPSAQLMTFGARAPGPSTTSIPPLPADIAGTTLRIDLGATVVAAYQTAASAADEQRLQHAFRGMDRASANGPAIAGPRPSLPGSGLRARSMRTFGIGHGLPLVVVQMPVPRIASTGVSVQRLASYMLAQPGVPPRVAAAFRALGDLSTTLPIPVPIDKAYTQPVFVDGVRGVGLGDDTGIGAAVIWQRSGMLYAVFATQPAREVLAIANSLR